MSTDGKPDPLPNGGVDITGRCLYCGFRIESTASCRCDARAAFEAMYEEQRAEYEDYVRRCNGTPISRIVP